MKLKGGEIITSSRVRKILVENGRAVGVELEGGKQIGAKKLIASSTDPATLILKLIGEDYVDTNISSSIKRMEWGDSIFGIYLALNGKLEYISGQEEVAKSCQVHISPCGLENFSKIFYECRSGKLPSNPLPIMSNDSMMDSTRIMPVNNNKHLIKFLVLSVPYQLDDDINNRESRKYGWEEVKDRYADQIIDNITKDYIPNLKDVILKKVAYSPSDYEKNL